MEIVSIKILRGPNYFSVNRKKLIALTLNLQEFEYKPSHTLPDFNHRLKKLLPSLHEHFCSYDEAGGFFKRCEEGTWLGHIIEHVALELQWLAGMKVGYGRTRMTGTLGVYHVVFAYEFEEAGLYAGNAAVKLVERLANGEDYESLNEDINQLKIIYQNKRFGPSTQSIIDEINKRQIPYAKLDNSALLVLGQGKHQKLIRATETSLTSIVGVDIASDKALTKHLLQAQYIPVPKGVEIYSLAELENAIEEIGFPLVIKPHNANHGKGITTLITSHEKAVIAFELAKKHSKLVIIEKYIAGADYRFLVVNYKLVAVAKRYPAQIIGNGVSTIQELIDAINKDPQRGFGHENNLTQIRVDSVTLAILEEKSLSLNSVLRNHQILNLKYAANLSSGGTAEDVTDHVHKSNQFLAERVARLMNLNLCGIDMIATDISTPITQATGAVIEVNSGPGLRMHLNPTMGPARNVAKPIVDMLFPPKSETRIPIVAVTGTNGKTTVVRLIAHIAAFMKHHVGFTTTDGIYINNKQIFKGDCSGPTSAGVVLRDPLVDFAVLECARGGIIRSGLGFDHCNIGIVTNISEDHLGLSGIDTLAQLARVKSVVPRSVFNDGYAILNAEDDYVYDMREDVRAKLALFSMDENNTRLVQHMEQGGLAAFYKNDSIYISNESKITKLINIMEVPLTFHGTSRCMIQNLLPVVLTAWALNFDHDTLVRALGSFIPNQKMLPGRMNIFRNGSCEVMVDYAHNAGAFAELKRFMATINAPKKIGIIAATGDRRDIDIIRVGAYAAEIFDEIIIRHDLDSRGRAHEVLDKLLVQGITSIKPSMKVTVIPDEFAAIDFAMKEGNDRSFIFYFPDSVEQALTYLQQKVHAPKQPNTEVCYES